MEVNYFGTIGLTKVDFTLNAKTKSGHIITISSLSGKFAFFRSAYSAAKFAQVGFFESLRLEKKNNILVSMVFPGCEDKYFAKMLFLEMEKTWRIR